MPDFSLLNPDMGAMPPAGNSAGGGFVSTPPAMPEPQSSIMPGAAEFQIWPLQDADAVLGRDRASEIACDAVHQLRDLVVFVGRRRVLCADMQIAITGMAEHNGVGIPVNRLHALVDGGGAAVTPGRDP